MTVHNLNDGTETPTYVGSGSFETEANGRAALLLVESLIHGLLARSLITVADAVEIVDAAIDVVQEGAHEHGNADAAAQTLSALGAIGSSLSRDLPIEAEAANDGEAGS